MTREAPDFSSMTPRELAAAVTPLFLIESRFQHEALNELVIRCEVAERLHAETPELTRLVTRRPL